MTQSEIKATFDAGICVQCQKPIDWRAGYTLGHDGLRCMRCSFPDEAQQKANELEADR